MYDLFRVRRAMFLGLAFFLVFTSCSGGGSDGKVLLRIDGERGVDEGLGSYVQQFADIDEDGIPEIISNAPYGLAGEIGVYSGSSGNLVYRISSVKGEYLIKSFSLVGDLDQDGVMEVAVPDSWADRGLYIFSGKDGKYLLQLEGKLYFQRYEPPRVLTIPDRNGDGVSELAFDQPRRGLIVFSGKDGKKLTEMEPPATLEERVFHSALSDVDGDGHDDILAFKSARRNKSENVYERITEMTFLTSSDIMAIAGPFDVPLPAPPEMYGCADMNGDGTTDLVFHHPNAGSHGESVLFVRSGKDGEELWRVSGGDIQGGSTIIRVDAKTGETVDSFTDIGFGDALAVIPDINADGICEVATGHPTFFDKTRKVGGCVLIFSGRDGSLLRTILSPDRNSHIGNSISSFADLNFDGNPDLLLGIPAAKPEGTKKVGGIIVMSL